MSAHELIDMMHAMREAFDRRDWDQTLILFQEMDDLKVLSRNTLVESVCLAARAMAAMNDRPGSRKLLKVLDKVQLSKPVHYALMAQAYMDLKNYKETARLCELVVALQENKQN